MTTKRILALVLSFVMMFTFIPAGTVAFADDTDDYIEIWTVDDLYNVRNDLSANYKLMADLDLTEVLAEGGKYNSGGNGWEPFGGTTSTPFTGVFDGNGHSIEGLVINGEYNGWSSFFWQNDGTIKNLHVQGSITKKENSYSGEALIVGLNTGTITKCTANASIDTVSEYSTGIIAAENTGIITACLSEGDISTYISNTDSKHAGGICGTSKDDSVITECVNLANVTIRAGNGSASGIAAYVTETVTIKDCYNAGNITGVYKNGQGSSNRFAWAIGIPSYSVNCYNIGICKEVGYSGAGTAIGNDTTNCYYLDSSGRSSSATALNETQMAMKSSFSGFDFENTWVISSATDYKYPQLRNNMQDPNKHVDIIEWKTQPTKIDFYTDEEIDPAGGVFTAYYIDDTHEDIEVTKDMLSGYDMTKTGVQTVTVTFREGTLTYDILTSTRPEVKSLTLETMPDKTEFARGTKFDFTGATAKVEYVNGKTEIIPITAEETTGGNIEQSGTYTITFEKYGKSITFEVKVVPVKPIGIKITSLPDKTTYLEGQSIDFTGMVVKLEYNSGKTETITDYTIGEYENTVGTKVITVSYENFATSFQVEFLEKSLTNIMVTTQPDRVKYVAGEQFDPTGMVVKAVYDNGFSEEVTDYTVTPMTDALGWQNLTVSYNGKTATVKVFVEEKELVSISISVLPAKTTYIEGEDFDPTGMVVLANYNDVYTEAINDYVISANTNKVGENTVTILYEGKTATFKINVVEKTLLKIEVTKPDKTEYIAGEEFDPTGMVVKAVYDNGKSEEVKDYTVSGFGDAQETNIVTIEYKGKTSAFAVVIHTPEDEWTITTPPTCTTEGSRELHCADCGKLLKTEAIQAKGHSWGEWTEVSSPSCTDKGSKKHVCATCGIEEFEDVDPIGHVWNTEYTIDKAATCTEEGSTSIHCSVCGVIDPGTVRTIEKLPHELGEWITTKEATCEVAGVKQRKCAHCDYLETEDIPALGHDWDEWTVVKEATTTEEGLEVRTCKRDPSHTETRAIPKKEPVVDGVTRIAGKSRYLTSLMSANAYKEQLGLDKFDNVIVACGTNYADALAGSYLSTVKEAPILLVRNRAAEIELVQDYIKDNLNENGTIYILGGTAVVPDTIKDALEGYNGFKVKRLKGKDRYATNVEILKEAGISGDEIIVASGIGFADSLSASALGKPVLLVKGTVQPSQEEYIKSLAGKHFCLIGGKGAVSEGIDTYLKGIGTTERISGKNRYETSAKVAERFFSAPDGAVLAYGEDYPDGLCGGSLANAIGGPLLLSRNGRTNYAADFAKSTGIKSGFVLGGKTLISDDDARTIFQMGADGEIIVK